MVPSASLVGSAARRTMLDAVGSPRLGRPSCRPGTSPLLSEVCGEAARAGQGKSRPIRTSPHARPGSTNNVPDRTASSLTNLGHSAVDYRLSRGPCCALAEADVLRMPARISLACADCGLDRRRCGYRCGGHRRRPPRLLCLAARWPAEASASHLGRLARADCR